MVARQRYSITYRLFIKAFGFHPKAFINNFLEIHPLIVPKASDFASRRETSRTPFYRIYVCQRCNYPSYLSVFKNPIPLAFPVYGNVNNVNALAQVG